MRIFYDDQAFNIDNKFGGIARCFIEVIKRMPCPVYASVLFSKLYYIHDIKPHVNDIFGNASFKGKRKVRCLLNKIYTYINLFFRRYDVLHITGENIYPKWLVKVPTIITIHDCIPEKIFYKGQPLPQRLKAMNYATHIIAVSENTKKDILSYYPSISTDKITVVYHGANNFKPSSQPNSYGRYVLYVGARTNSYKNFNQLLSAMLPIFKEDEESRLICAGNTFNVDEFKIIEQTGFSERIIALQCNDQKLVNLYTHALAFVYPSLYEGFGIPILEAWQLHCPVILSRASCFPEIADDAGEYFDPTNEKDMEIAIRSVIYNENRRNELKRRGDERVHLFSWEKAANELMQIYSRFCNS